jgi:DnaJ-class molecular chaperone
MAVRKRICFSCDETGQEPVQCAACLGAGRVVALGSHREYDCEECGGSGMIMEVCSACGGRLHTPHSSSRRHVSVDVQRDLPTGGKS